MKINISMDVEVNELKELFGSIEKLKGGKKELYEGNAKVNEQKSFSQYARMFNDGCTKWTKDPEYNLMILESIQQYANDVLRAKGYIFLNDVYDMLGFPKTKTGDIVGWIYDEKNPHGDNFIDFGLYDRSIQCGDFVNGYSKNILLDFNVDGNILNLI